MGPGAHVHVLHLSGLLLRRHCRAFVDAKPLCVKQGYPASAAPCFRRTHRDSDARSHREARGAQTLGPGRKHCGETILITSSMGEKGKELPVEGVPARSNALIGALSRSVGAGPAADPAWLPDNVCQDRRRGPWCANDTAHWLALAGPDPENGSDPGQSQTVIPATGFPSPAPHFDYRDSMAFQTGARTELFSFPNGQVC